MSSSLSSHLHFHEVLFTIGRWQITYGHIAIMIATAILGLTIVIHLVMVRDEIHRFWNWVHFLAGTIGLLAWLLFLVLPTKEVSASDLIGVIGLGGFWVVGVAGLPLLGREWPRRRRHADGTVTHHGSWWVVPGFPLALASGLVLTVGYMLAWV